MTGRHEETAARGFDPGLFDGRVVLVCGVAAGGIGGATVRTLAAAGATVVCLDHSEEIIERTLAQINAREPRGHGIVADLLDAERCGTIIDAVVERFGRLDGLANVAGGTRPGEWMPLEATGMESFGRTFGLNLDYVFRICRDAARSMIARDAPAPMVNVSSISGLNSAPMHGPYGAAKAGMIALTRTMAFEWARHGIRVNCVSPGAVATERVTATGMTPDAVAAADAPSDVVPTTADEVANAIVFLLSDLASGISGHNLVVDSGITTRNAVLSLRMDARKGTG